MFAYNPEKFASLYASPLGQRLWAFLTRPENVARLETASELSKPAVEGIEEQLLAEFREDVLANRVKQMVGHMVRQIMEQRDWVLDQTDVKVQSVPFSKATRYRRPDWFTFHAFPQYRRSMRRRHHGSEAESDAPFRLALDVLCDVRQPAEGGSGIRRP